MVYQKGIEVTSGDKAAAQRIAGVLSDAPIEPFGRQKLRFADVLARSIRIRRYAREHLKANWLIIAAFGAKFGQSPRPLRFPGAGKKYEYLDFMVELRTLIGKDGKKSWVMVNREPGRWFKGNF